MQVARILKYRPLQILPECGEVWVGDCGKVFAVGFAEPPRRLALLARN